MGLLPLDADRQRHADDHQHDDRDHHPIRRAARLGLDDQTADPELRADELAHDQPRYSDLAIELVLTLRLVFHLALRQAEGFTRSVLTLLDLELAVPDHTTLCRRGRTFAGRQPRVRAGTGPVHLVLDGTGLELFGQGEWCAAKHGRLRRRWLKLDVGVDANTGEIAAHVLTEEDGDDAAQSPNLLRRCEGTLASLTADGAYDRDPVYQAAATAR